MPNTIVFLVLVDGSEEMDLALKFACMRASGRKARIALAYVVEPPGEGQNWLSISNLALQQSREDAEKTLEQASALIYEKTGEIAISYMREGDTPEQFYDIIQTEPVSFAVVAASKNGGTYDRVLSYLLKKGYNNIPVPLVIVPSCITDSQLEALK